MNKFFASVACAFASLKSKFVSTVAENVKKVRFFLTVSKYAVLLLALLWASLFALAGLFIYYCFIQVKHYVLSFFGVRVYHFYTDVSGKLVLEKGITIDGEYFIKGGILS